jgi:hypothetical protein
VSAQGSINQSLNEAWRASKRRAHRVVITDIKADESLRSDP